MVMHYAMPRIYSLLFPVPCSLFPKLMHLDVRTYYSFHDGVASPAELCAHAAELGFAEVGIADIDGTYGLIQFYKAAMKAGVKPILGIALTKKEGFRSQDAGFRGDASSRGEAMLRPY